MPKTPADGAQRLLSERFTEALRFAAERHADQARKGDDAIPYVSHLLGAGSLVLEHGANEDEAIAALLHDAVEDGKATLDEIRDRFGDTVADIVRGCSDTDQQKKPAWRPRKERWIKSLQTAGPSVRLVAAADKLHNARAVLRDYRRLGEALWSRFQGKKDGTLWYYDDVLATFREADDPRLAAIVDDLAEVVAELHRRVEENEPGTK